MISASVSTILLVVCVQAKIGTAAAARDLYRSTWFCKARCYADATHEPWFILSARHGLLEPTQRIAPYDARLADLSKAHRQAWALNVAKQLDEFIYPGVGVVLLAGLRYREHLEPALDRRGLHTTAPLARLGIGQQMQWFDRQTSAIERKRR